MTHAAADIPGVVYNGKLYVFGGYGGSSTDCLNYTQIYDPSTNSWSQGATMPTARWGAAAAAYGGKIYVFGGRLGSIAASNKCEIYNVGNNSWTTGTNLPVAQDNGIMAVTVGSKIYLFRYQYVYEFDPAGNGGLGTYTAKTAPPSSARKKWANCAYVNVGGQDRIYIIGGSTSSEVYTDTNYYYMPRSNTWSAAQATAPYNAHGVTRDNPVYNGKIYYGLGYNASFYSCLFYYNPSTNIWSTQLASSGHPRDGQACGFVGDTLYCVGGRDNPNGSNPHGVGYNEAYEAEVSSSLGTLTQLHILFNTANPTGNAHLGIYADLNGAPDILMLDTQVAVANGWVTASGLNLPVVAGCYYWLSFELSAANGVQYQSGQPANSHAYDSYLGSYKSLPYELAYLVYDNSQFVMRATVQR